VLIAVCLAALIAAAEAPQELTIAAAYEQPAQPKGKKETPKQAKDPDQPKKAKKKKAPKEGEVELIRLAKETALGLLVSYGLARRSFRFKAGMIQTLAACCAAGVVLYLAGALA
jgi:hypothetical protein